MLVSYSSVMYSTFLFLNDSFYLYSLYSLWFYWWFTEHYWIFSIEVSFLHRWESPVYIALHLQIILNIVIMAFLLHYFNSKILLIKSKKKFVVLATFVFVCNFVVSDLTQDPLSILSIQLVSSRLTMDIMWICGSYFRLKNKYNESKVSVS